MGLTPIFRAGLQSGLGLNDLLGLSCTWRPVTRKPARRVARWRLKALLLQEIEYLAGIKGRPPIPVGIVAIATNHHVIAYNTATMVRALPELELSIAAEALSYKWIHERSPWSLALIQAGPRSGFGLNDLLCAKVSPKPPACNGGVLTESRNSLAVSPEQGGTSALPANIR